MTGTAVDLEALGPMPDLNPTHIRWKVDSAPSTRDDETSARFVAYVTMERLAGLLDDWVGPERWHATFDPVGSHVWCHITVTTSTGQAITKTDVGDFDKSMKAAVSDSFKRCASRMWGAGREVRSLPYLWAPCRTYELDGETYAAANSHTIPTLRRKLADLGHAGFGDDVDGSEHLDPAELGEAQPAPPLNPAAAGRINPDLHQVALGDLAVEVALLELDQTGAADWAAWKEAHVGWQKTLDGVQLAAKTVGYLLDQIQPDTNTPSEEDGDEPF